MTPGRWPTSGDRRRAAGRAPPIPWSAGCPQASGSGRTRTAPRNRSAGSPPDDVSCSPPSPSLRAPRQATQSRQRQVASGTRSVVVHEAGAEQRLDVLNALLVAFLEVELCEALTGL